MLPGDNDWTEYKIDQTLTATYQDSGRPYLFYFQPNVRDIIDLANNRNFIGLEFQQYEMFKISMVVYTFTPEFTSENYIAWGGMAGVANDFNYGGLDMMRGRMIWGFAPSHRRLQANVPVTNVYDIGWDDVLAGRTGMHMHKLDKELRIAFRPRCNVPLLTNSTTDSSNVSVNGIPTGTATFAPTDIGIVRDVPSPWIPTTQSRQYLSTVIPAGPVYHGMYLGFPGHLAKNFRWNFKVTYYCLFKDRVGTL